jgi:bacillopeptidase F (M6 metalloprotease family)
VSYDAGIYDWLDVTIEDATTGAVLRSIVSRASGNPGPNYGFYNTTGWKQVSADLRALAGKKVRIRFSVHQDGYGDQTAAYIDNIKILCSTPAM